MSNVDAKGKFAPKPARYVENIAALGGHAGYKEGGLAGGNYISFSLYLAAASTVVFTTVDDPATEVTYAFPAGTVDIALATVTSSSTAALALFAQKPVGA